MEKTKSPSSISVPLSDEVKAILSSVFPDLEDQVEAASMVARLAFDSWIAWLAGKRTYSSITDQQIEWVEQLYEQLLPDEEPSSDRLYNNFNIPPGTADYIARQLARRDIRKWKLRAYDELTERLTEAKGEWASRRPEDKILQPTIRIQVSDRASRLLNLTIQRLILSGEDMEPPVAEKPLPNLVYLKIKGELIQRLLDECEKLRNRWKE